MKTLLFCLFMASMTLVHAQSEESGPRKGKIFIETGLTTFGNLFGNSTGGSFLSFDGESITNIAFSGGKFISDDFAIRAKLSLLTGFVNTITVLGVGAKYYANGFIPLSFEIGKGFSDVNSDLIGGVSGGYAIVLADNIYLEPSLGYLFEFDDLGEGQFNINLGFNLLF